jgi:hypothetical protein
LKIVKAVEALFGGCACCGDVVEQEYLLQDFFVLLSYRELPTSANLDELSI